MEENNPKSSPGVSFWSAKGPPATCERIQLIWKEGRRFSFLWGFLVVFFSLFFFGFFLLVVVGQEGGGQVT